MPGPIAATRTVASARASSPRRASPRSKNASTPLADVNTSHAKLVELREREVDGLECDRRQLDHRGAELLEARAQLARLFTGPGHHDGSAEQRPLFEPAELEGGDRTDNDRAGRLDTELIDRVQRGPHRPLLGSCPPAHRGNRRGAIAPARDQRLRNLADAARAHQHDDGPAGARERVPVGVGRSLGRIFVTGHDRDAGGKSAVRHRNPGVGGRGNRARDTGDHFERDARVAARFGFFAAATEHERVAALQPNDFETGFPALDEQFVDLVLRHRDAAGRLAHIDELRVSRREFEQRGRREPVVHDHLRAP